MDSHTLAAWCKAKRGRANTLATALNVSKPFIAQLCSGVRPIPPTMLVLIEHEVKRSERLGEPQADPEVLAELRKRPPPPKKSRRKAATEAAA